MNFYICTDTRTLRVKYVYCLSVEVNSLFSVSCFLFQGHNIKQYNLLTILTLSDISLLFKNKIKLKVTMNLLPNQDTRNYIWRNFLLESTALLSYSYLGLLLPFATLIFYLVRLLQAARLFHIKFYHTYALHIWLVCNQLHI